MRWLLSLMLVLLTVGTFRVVGCGDEGIPCQTNKECDDDNECTDDVCSGGYCRNPEVGSVLYNELPVFCDLDGVEQFYEDGICVSRTCERREPPTSQYMCTDYICTRTGPVYPVSNSCTNDIYDEGTCAHTLEPNGSSCCYRLERYNCSITGGCQYRCTDFGECRDGHCCYGPFAELCFEFTRPRGYCDSF